MIQSIICSQKEILASGILCSFLLDTIIENLSYIFGEDMETPENRREWIQYNLERYDPRWRVVIVQRNGENAGFLIYSIQDACLTINDFEITKKFRFDFPILRNLIGTLVQTERHRFETIDGYINKENLVSQRNFLKYATSVSETERGYILHVNTISTAKIKEKF